MAARARSFRWRRAAWTIAAIFAAAMLMRPLFMPVAEASEPGRQPDEFRPGVVLVKFKPLVFSAMADGLLSIQGYRTLQNIAEIGVRIVEVTPGREIDAISSLKNNPLVEYAEPDFVRRTVWVPDDVHYTPKQWNLEKINLEAAWDISRGSPDIRVAVIDTGLDMSHPDLPVNIVSPSNECPGDSTMSDDDGHGTHVSGIIAASTNNAIGVAGVAPNVSLMPIRVECNGTIFVSTEIAAVRYAADHGAHVINISLSGPTWLYSEQAAMNYAMRKGAMVVAAAGNEYQSGNPPSYPAAYPGVFAVAATTANDAHASYSQVQPYVSIAAPGGDGGNSNKWVLSTYLDTTYAYLAGTSMAAPHVSGLAGLVWSVNPSLNNVSVASVITSTAVDLGAQGRDDTFGWGRIDASAAVAAARQTLSVPMPTATPTPIVAPTATPTRTMTPTPGVKPAATPTATPAVTATGIPTAISTATAGPSPTPTSMPVDPTPNPTPSLPLLRSYLPVLDRSSTGW